MLTHSISKTTFDGSQNANARLEILLTHLLLF